MLKRGMKPMEATMADHRQGNPYTQSQKGQQTNPYTKGEADQATARRLGYDTKSDSPSPTGLRGAHPKKY